MVDSKDVAGESSTPSALENAIASSPEVEQEAKVQEAQTPTAEEKGTPEPEPEEAKIPYSRLKEVVDEKNWYRQQLEQRLNQPQQSIQQPTTNQYANMTPEEERFWRAVDERAEKVAERKMAQITPVIEAGRMEIAQSKVHQFRQSHPDIKPNSPEEMEIAQRISSGYLPDDAYWSVMGPRGMRVAEEKGKQIVKNQIEAKKKANVEATSSVSQQAVPPGKMSFRQHNAWLLEQAESGKL